MSSTQATKSSEIKIIFLTVFIYLVGFGMVLPIIPMLSREYGATSIQTGWLLSIYSIMQFIFSPVWGRLSDKWGRRPILLICLGGEVVAYLIFAFSRNLELLFISRILSGFFGASISTASAYISDITEAKDRTKGMAIIGAAFGLGFVLGPSIGGGLSLLAQKNGVTEVSNVLTIVGCTVSAFCLATFIFAYFRLPEPIRHKSALVGSRLKRLSNYILRQPVNVPLLTYFMVGLSMAAMESTLVLYMADVFDWGIKQTSFGFAYVGITMAITQGLIVRKIIPIFGEAKVLFMSLVFFTIGMTGIAFSSDMWGLGISMTLLSVGVGLTNPSLLGMISLLSPSETQGEALGVAQSLSSLGRILGPLAGGFIYAYTMTGPFLFAGGVGLVCWLLVITYRHLLPQSGKEKHGIHT